MFSSASQFFILLLLLVARGSLGGPRDLKTVYEWKYIDYLWDSDAQREEYVRSGRYDHRSVVPIDVDKAKDGRVFVTAIRDVGVPASLSVVTDRLGPSGPLLRPYPDWSWYNRRDCDGITSVYRVAMDECNKLYVLDTGYIGERYVCPHQILVFDLGTDRLIDRIKIPNGVSHNSSGVGKLVTPVIEVDGPSCDLKSIFMADVTGRGLVVWTKQRLFRLEARVFQPEERFVKVSIAGESFDLEDSLMGMALTPRHLGTELYLRPFASRHLYAADTRVLSRSIYGDSIKYKEGKDMLPSQAAAMAMSAGGTLFFGLTGECAIGCWHRDRNMSSDHVDLAAEDQQRLQFASGLKVIPSTRTGADEEVWVSTNRLQKIYKGTQNFNEINFRVMKNSVGNLIRGTKCEPAGNGHGSMHIGSMLHAPMHHH